MTKVYVATKGEYSDYQIVRVFATREAAAQFVGGGGAAEVEEWELEETCPRRVVVYNFVGRIQLGSYPNPQPWNWEDVKWLDDDDDEPPRLEVVGPYWDPTSIAAQRDLEIHIRGTDRQAVSQTFSDQRAMMKVWLDACAAAHELREAQIVEDWDKPVGRCMVCGNLKTYCVC